MRHLVSWRGDRTTRYHPRRGPSTMRAPAKIILVHGTWGRGFNPDKYARSEVAGNPTDPRWFEAGSKFRAMLSSGLSGLIQATDINAFTWSGSNSIEERRSAVARLAKTLDESVAAAPKAIHFIIAHSHGGNVAVLARQAMSGNTHNVHIVTMATPFLSIDQRTPRTTDKLFTICISIALTILAICMWWYIGASHKYTAYLFPYTLFSISLFSVFFGAATLLSSAYRSIQKKQVLSGRRSNGLTLAKRINNRSLLVSALLLCAGSPLFGGGTMIATLLILMPSLLVLFF